MFVEKYTRVECASCRASFSVIDASNDENKYTVEFCAYCGDESIDTEEES